MTDSNITVSSYFENLPEERKVVMKKLWQVYQKEPPLPFLCMASQKNFIPLYHMGMEEWIQIYNKNVKS